MSSRRTNFSFRALLALSMILLQCAKGSGEAPTLSQLSLDGGNWRLATDPKNTGREEKWFTQPRASAVETRVPWIIQEAFPGYHGVAWYWREFVAPAHSDSKGHYLLRFWAVDYEAEVWVNGVAVGNHEGGETPFTLDITAAVKPNTSNLLAVRILNPSNERIDGMVLRETPARNKVIPYGGGSSYDHGGIVDSVELLIAPVVRVEDFFVRAAPRTGVIHTRTNLRNSSNRTVKIELQLSVAPAAGGAKLASKKVSRRLQPGDTVVEQELQIDQPHLWELSDPFLYRVTAGVTQDNSSSTEEQSVRCGFRDFRFENGFFRLNGKRIFLRCSHTGNHCPIGLQLPPDPEFLRRDLLNVKVMGFNAIRFIAGLGTRSQLDLCDEIGLLVYEESYAGWCLADSPKMGERFDRSVAEMIQRDRNHPSVVMWGLLNETGDGPVFKHAVSTLPWVRALDDTRVVMLNSGRFDLPPTSALEGLQVWHGPAGPDPNVTHNPTSNALPAPWANWPPGQVALHPGPTGQASVVRWTAPTAGEYAVSCTFSALGNKPTTDVHIWQRDQQVFESSLDLGATSNSTSWKGKILAAQNETIDFVVGPGSGSYGGDTTGLSATIRSMDGNSYEVGKDFSIRRNTKTSWSYGFLRRERGGNHFEPYAEFEIIGAATNAIGSLSNPESGVWEDVLGDQHPYQRVPHTAEIIHTLRTLGGGRNPVFVSEYGIGSAVNLFRVVRQYEQWGKGGLEDAQFYRDKLDRFLADWSRWQMQDVFGRPEDFFTASLRKMAGQRLLGLNALRSNPNLIGHSLTGTVDQGMSGEGLFTTFRELKPGTVDALFDGWAPLRWCLFVEPLNVYRGTPLRLEAVLADEDVLAAGRYPVRLQVLAPDNKIVWSSQSVLAIESRGTKPEPSFARLIESKDVVIQGPPGKYRFLATFDRGAAPAGGETEFYVADVSKGPGLKEQVVQWGEDSGLAKWLDAQGIARRAFVPEPQTAPEIILASATPAQPGGVKAFETLLEHVGRGSIVVFLSPEIFKRGAESLGFLPLSRKGALKRLTGGLYHKDEWARDHPIFAGLPTGMLDYNYYREIIPDVVFAGMEGPATVVSAANDASIDYSSGLLMAVYRFGSGQFVVNSLHIREHLGSHPVADQLLRNLVHFASTQLKEKLSDLPGDFETQLKTFGYD